MRVEERHAVVEDSWCGPVHVCRGCLRPEGQHHTDDCPEVYADEIAADMAGEDMHETHTPHDAAEGE